MAPMGDRTYVEVDDLPVEVDEDGYVYADVLDASGRSASVNLTDWLSSRSLVAIRAAARQQRAEDITYDEARR